MESVFVVETLGPGTLEVFCNDLGNFLRGFVGWAPRARGEGPEEIIQRLRSYINISMDVIR